MDLGEGPRHLQDRWAAGWAGRDGQGAGVPDTKMEGWQEAGPSTTQHRRKVSQWQLLPRSPKPIGHSPAEAGGEDPIQVIEPWTDLVSSKVLTLMGKPSPIRLPFQTDVAAPGPGFSCAQGSGGSPPLGLCTGCVLCLDTLSYLLASERLFQLQNLAKHPLGRETLSYPRCVEITLACGCV